MKFRQILCAIGWHAFNRARRVSGSLRRRRCRVCGYREMQLMDRGLWVVEPKGMKVDRTPLEIIPRVADDYTPPPLRGQQPDQPA